MQFLISTNACCKEKFPVEIDQSIGHSQETSNYTSEVDIPMIRGIRVVEEALRIATAPEELIRRIGTDLVRIVPICFPVLHKLGGASELTLASVNTAQVEILQE